MTNDFTSTDARNEENLDPIVLDRYWLGECSPEEAAIVERWFAIHPEWRIRYKSLQQGIVEGGFSVADVNRLIAKTLGTIALDSTYDLSGLQSHQQATPNLPASRERSRSSSLSAKSSEDTSASTLQHISGSNQLARQSSFSRIAVVLAVFAVAALTGLFVKRNSSHDNSQPIVGIEQGDKSIYTTPNGQRAHITLPDGSEVVLNAGSRLEVPTNFSDGARTVELVGEAYFVVSQHEARPFTVISGPSITRVLGTRFVVRHFQTDAVAIVAVQDGKVSVNSAILSANQEVHVSHDNVSLPQISSLDRLSFTKGMLVINGRKLREAIPDLNRWYDIDIHLGDSSIGEQRLAWESTSGSISDFTSIIELVVPVRAIRDGRTVTILKR